MPAAVDTTVVARTLKDCAHTCDVIALAAKYAGDSLLDAYDGHGPGRAHAAKQLRVVLAGLPGLIADIERMTP